MEAIRSIFLSGNRPLVLLLLLFFFSSPVLLCLALVLFRCFVFSSGLLILLFLIFLLLLQFLAACSACVCLSFIKSLADHIASAGQISSRLVCYRVCVRVCVHCVCSGWWPGGVMDTQWEEGGVVLGPWSGALFLILYTRTSQRSSKSH